MAERDTINYDPYLVTLSGGSVGSGLATEATLQALLDFFDTTIYVADRGDGFPAIRTDTEMTLNGNVIIDNIFVASTDGTSVGAGYMWMETYLATRDLYVHDRRVLAAITALSVISGGLATEATLLAFQADFNAEDFATQTTLASVLAELVAINADIDVPLSTVATEVTLAALFAAFTAEDFATETTQVLVRTAVQNIDTDLGAPGDAAWDGVAASAAVIPILKRISAQVDSLDGKSYVTSVNNDYGVTPVTIGAWVQLIASTSADINFLDIFDSSGEILELGTGAAAAEARRLLINPGGNGQIPLNIPAATRVSVRAVSANASVGNLVINFLS
jgi:hypothetical protein